MSKGSIDTRATSKKAKTIVLLIKWNWSKYDVIYGIKSASESASAHCRPARAIYSSQSNNQSNHWVSGVCAMSVSWVCAKTLLRIVKRIRVRRILNRGNEDFSCVFLRLPNWKRNWSSSIRNWTSTRLTRRNASWDWPTRPTRPVSSCSSFSENTAPFSTATWKCARNSKRTTGCCRRRKAGKKMTHAGFHFRRLKNIQNKKKIELFFKIWKIPFYFIKNINQISLQNIRSVQKWEMNKLYQARTIFWHKIWRGVVLPLRHRFRRFNL